MVSDRTSAGRRILLNRLYDRYAVDPSFAHMRPHVFGMVPGIGPISPRLVFVGEAPGSNEDKHGRPFIGASGQFLNELLESVGLKREEVFITNTVKYRPVVVRDVTRPYDKKPRMSKNNRPPTEQEKLASIPYLRREMEILGMPPIVILGKHAKSAMAQLPPRGYPLGDIEDGMKLGEWTTVFGVPMLPLHHPAYGIYQQANRPMMFDMFKAVLNPPKVNT